MSIKNDAGKPDLALLIQGFPKALRAVGDVATFGLTVPGHTRHGWRTVENGADRYMSALMRHLLDYGEEHGRSGTPVDKESGLPILAHVAWNALAILELSLGECTVRVSGVPYPVSTDDIIKPGGVVRVRDLKDLGHSEVFNYSKGTRELIAKWKQEAEDARARKAEEYKGEGK